jgi:hypothetical protein
MLNIKPFIHHDRTFELQFNVPEGCRSVTLVLPQGRKYLLDSKKAAPDKLLNGKAYFTVGRQNKTVTVLN